MNVTKLFINTLDRECFTEVYSFPFISNFGVHKSLIHLYIFGIVFWNSQRINQTAER